MLIPPTDRNSIRLAHLAVAAMAVMVARGAFHAYTGFLFDDAFITFRYAANLADGSGFVYNLGERVLGTTTPLWTLLLAAARTLGVPLSVAAVGFSTVAAGLCAALIYRWARELRFGVLAWLPVIAFALFPRLLPTDTGGMETALFTFLATAGLYYTSRDSFRPAALFGALALLARPEGLVVLGLLVVVIVVRQPRRLLSAIALAAAIVVPWIVFAWFYFGSPVPHSMLAKAALYGEVWSRPPLERFSFLMGWHHPMAWALAVCGCLGGWHLYRSRRFGLLAAAWIIILIAGYTMADTKVFRWYVAPIYPVYIMLACGAAVMAFERMAGLARVRAWLAPSLLAAVTVMMAIACYPTFRHYAYEWRALNEIHTGIATYLAEYARPGDVLATEDIGEVGFLTNMTILDRAGLVSPEVVSYNAARDYWGALRDRRPQWLVISPRDPTAWFLDDPEFRAMYERRCEFRPPRDSDWPFELYARRR